MSYLTFLFSSQTQGMVNGSEASRLAEHDGFAASEARGKARIRAGEGSDDYRLPSGVVSMEHWLDLNA